MRNAYEAAAIMFSLLREDFIFVDKNSYHYSLTKREGFHSYSEIFANKFSGGYSCDSMGRVIAKSARCINLEHMKQVLISKDQGVLEANQWMFDGEFRFLDGTSIANDKVGFSSFPRSGNSFLRRYVEQLTGVTTGSCMSIHTSTSMQVMGMKGESHIGDNVWVVKSHHPFAVFGASTFNSTKTFISVRHPLDVFPSYAAYCNTFSHGNKPDFDFLDYPEWWTWFVKTQTDYMQRWFEILLRNCGQEGKNPLYIVRYEDLVMKPKETLMGLACYLLEQNDLSGTNMERRID